MAHVLLYAPSPWVKAGYGRQPPLCAKPPNTSFCHGPHLYSEWWVGGNIHDDKRRPENLSSWERPVRRTRAAPLDKWLMAPPMAFGGKYVWVGNGDVYSLPAHRIAGLYAPANGAFTTNPFEFTQGGKILLNADAAWGSKLVTGGCDEGCAAYIMVELQDAATGQVIPTFERESCTFMNVTGAQIPLAWAGSAPANAAGKLVQLRIYFRDATIYALTFAE